MNKTPICIKLTEDEMPILERVDRSLTAPHRDVIRARTILLLAQGWTISAVARKVGRERRIVRKWAERFRKKRLKGLGDEARSGRPARFSPLCGGRVDQARL